MPMSAIELYMERLQKRHAEMSLMLGEAAKVPHMDEDGQRNWAKRIQETLYGDEKLDSSPARIKMIGIGVHLVQ